MRISGKPFTRQFCDPSWPACCAGGAEYVYSSDVVCWADIEEGAGKSASLKTLYKLHKSYLLNVEE